MRVVQKGIPWIPAQVRLGSVARGTLLAALHPAKCPPWGEGLLRKGTVGALLPGKSCLWSSRPAGLPTGTQVPLGLE